MATSKATLDRLSARISQLAVSVGVQSELAVISVPSSMSEDAVLEQHYKLYPQDRQAKLTVILRHFGEANPDTAPLPHEDAKVSRAWRELAREERPLQFWNVPDGTLPQ